MSWQEYINRMETEGCMYSGIFDQQGNKWAESQHCNLKIEKAHIDTVVQGLKSSTLYSGQGIMFGDRKYMVVAKTEDTAVLKELPGKDDKEGKDAKDKLMACVSLSNKGVCVGAASGKNEKCSRASAEKYAQYLRDLNY